jgi:hypothetical protein
VRWVKLNVVQLCRLLGWLAPLLILRSVGLYFSKVSFSFYCRFMFALSSVTMTANVLRLPDGFYFGLSWHCRFVKNIAIKIEKLLTEIYIAIFSLQEI